MYSFLQKIIVVLCLLLSVPTVSTMAATSWKTPTQPVLPTKMWSITLNESVLASSVNANTVYVTDKMGNLMNTTATVSTANDQIIYVHPPTNGYDHGKTYTLHIDKSIASKQHSKTLQDNVNMQFSINTINYKQLVLGEWNTTYNGMFIPVTFNADMATSVMGFPGTYSITGAEMSVTILEKSVTGTIKQVSNSSFMIVDSSGNTLTFTK